MIRSAVAIQENLLLFTIPFSLAMQGGFIAWIVLEYRKERRSSS
jgi:hypothetical protein